MEEKLSFVIENGVLKEIIQEDSMWGELDIVIPDGVRAIAAEAFMENHFLRTVTLPGSVVEIGKDAFAHCNYLESFLTGDGLVHLGNIFDSCEGLRHIHIGKAVCEIDGDAFPAFCNSLSRITVDEGNEYFASVDGVLYSKDGTRLIKYPGLINGESYIIREGVKEICSRAFRGAEALKHIELPQTLTAIGDEAFFNTGLEEVIIPSGVTVGNKAFSCCGKLLQLTVGSDASLGESSFSYTSVRNARIGDNVTIGANAFNNAKQLLSVTFSPGAESAVIGDCAFSVCERLGYINLPRTAIIGREAFRYCGALKEIELSSGEIGSIAFNKCTSLEGVHIGGGVSKIGCNIFRDCPKLAEVLIDDSNMSYEVKAGAIFTKDGKLLLSVLHHSLNNQYKVPAGTECIYKYAFYGDEELVSIILPESLKVIGACAFAHSTLISLHIPAGVEDIGEDALYSTVDHFITSVSKDNPTFEAKASALVDKRDGTLIKMPQAYRRDEAIIPEGVRRIGKNALMGCTDVKSVILPDSLEEIGENAFYHCSSIDEIVIPDSVRVIGKAAFGCCDRLKSIIIPDNVEEIGEEAFISCNSLSAVTFGKGLSVIPNNAFTSCDALKELEIPDSITSLGSAFFGCSELERVKIGEGVCEIPDKCFAACRSLASLELGSSVTGIGRDAFDSSALTCVHIPASVISIDYGAFRTRCDGETTSLTFDNPYGWVREDVDGYRLALENANEVVYTFSAHDLFRLYRVSEEEWEELICQHRKNMAEIKQASSADGSIPF